jgi:hypothetical protein
MISWVVLSKTRVELTPGSLRAHLDRLYPGLFLPPQELRNFVVERLVFIDVLVKRGYHRVESLPSDRRRVRLPLWLTFH